MEKFSLIENEYKIPNSFLVMIDPGMIILLRQTRSVMSDEGLESLASSIKRNGQKTPGMIFAFTDLQSYTYLDYINKLWHTEYKVSDFEKVYIEEKGEEYYLFLVAGHRRRKACKILGVKYVAQIFFEKSFKEAISSQYEENFHEQISLLDLVTFASYFWVLSKKEDPKLTLKKFAKDIHRSPHWLSNALKFSELPLSIQDLINKTEISSGVNYTILVEFAKLYDFSILKNKKLDEQLLLSFINHCISHKYNVKKVKEFCQIKKEEIAGQEVLFMLSVEDINNTTLTTLRKNKTLNMTLANAYLKAAGPIVKTITENCRTKAAQGIDSGQELGKMLTGD